MENSHVEIPVSNHLLYNRIVKAIHVLYELEFFTVQMDSVTVVGVAPSVREGFVGLTRAEDNSMVI
jgi:hypothetical protein